MNDQIAQAGERFRHDTEHHVMTVLHDDGLYRHLRFGRPDSSRYWFDLVTWPGYLAIDGDMGGFVFARMEDMFTFFRAASGWNSGTINPQYWAEKLCADSGVREYSEAKLRQLVAETVTDYEADHPGLRTAVQRRVLDEDLFSEGVARQVLDEFVHGRPPVPGEPDRRFRFENSWEWDLTTYTLRYLWCCHAIQWGIGQHDAARLVVAA